MSCGLTAGIKCNRIAWKSPNLVWQIEMRNWTKCSVDYYSYCQLDLFLICRLAPRRRGLMRLDPSQFSSSRPSIRDWRGTCHQREWKPTTCLKENSPSSQNKMCREKVCLLLEVNCNLIMVKRIETNKV